MDKDRQIRFLYPPLIFLCSLAMGILLDSSSDIQNKIIVFLRSENNTSIIVALFGLSSLVLVLGFLIGTITVFVLRLLFFRNNWNYEVKLTEQAYIDIGKKIFSNLPQTISTIDKLYVGIVFDHGFLPKNIHLWIVRRWNAFFISSSSAIAILSSLFIGILLGVPISCTWFFVSVFFLILFFIQSRFSWKETMTMIEFMTRVKTSESQNPQPSDEDN